jgi:hypothetical protein
MAFDSPEAKQLNKEIFETIYYAALQVFRGNGKPGCGNRRAGARSPGLFKLPPGHPRPAPARAQRAAPRTLRLPQTPPPPRPKPPEQTSNKLAKEQGPYASYEGSPVSKGVLQHDMWGVPPPSTRWDWAGLRAAIAEHGVRNSLLVAPMPTASTSQILGNNECFEPYTSNIYVRRVLSGERKGGRGLFLVGPWVG